jgi:REP element-mobilizing transposase RayT
MPPPGKQWFHITFGTLGSWLPGDPRGFRTKHEKIHSSGHHRAPPPPGEHAKLLCYSEQLRPDAVVILKPLLPVIGHAIIESAGQHGYRINALSIAPMHAHLLIELPRTGTVAEVGKLKRRASFAIKDRMPGRVWAKGCGVKPIKDKSHLVNTFNYILRHKEQGAWVWSFRDEQQL